ncbi:MAG TPA: hypothetical protein VNC84_04265 [Gammaproteobacteria bacterium]|nr:hypothetical protein [Gammaproteobacteria bacterium]
MTAPRTDTTNALSDLLERPEREIMSALLSEPTALRSLLSQCANTDVTDRLSLLPMVSFLQSSSLGRIFSDPDNAAQLINNDNKLIQLAFFINVNFSHNVQRGIESIQFDERCNPTFPSVDKILLKPEFKRDNPELALYPFLMQVVMELKPSEFTPYEDLMKLAKKLRFEFLPREFSERSNERRELACLSRSSLTLFDTQVNLIDQYIAGDIMQEIRDAVVKEIADNSLNQTKKL